MTKKKLLLFVNLSTYLTQEEIAVVSEYAMLQNIKVLLLDHRDFLTCKNTKKVVIDEDFVVLTKYTIFDTIVTVKEITKMNTCFRAVLFSMLPKHYEDISR